MSRSHRVKVLTKRMVATRDRFNSLSSGRGHARVGRTSEVALMLLFTGKLFEHHVYSSVVRKAERDALLRIDGQMFGYKQ